MYTCTHTVHTGQARQENARLMQTAALCHVRYFMLAKYYEQVGDVAPGTPERLVLHRLATFYALSDVVVRAVVVVGCAACGPLL